MIKTVCLVDKQGTALDRLAKGVAKYHSNLDYVVIDCHPKRPSPEQLQRVEAECKNADIIDAQYYRTIEKLREIFPWLRNIKTVLTMNNPYSIHEQDWNDYDLLVGNNKSIYEELGKITLKPVEYAALAVDADFWQFNPEYKFDRSVIMVANRIEGKKGILPVAQACREIDAKLILVGDVSDPNYLTEILQTGNVEFHKTVSDEKLRELYYKAGIHVCNSVDNFESGTLPILEAAFCGVPVFTRKVGHVPDILSGDNFAIQSEQPEATKYIAGQLTRLFSDHEKLREMRDKAWNSVKGYNFERRAYRYQRLYRQVLFDDTSVSVIMPVFENPEITLQAMEAVANQTYKNIELIVIDDGASQAKLVTDFARFVSFPVRYLHTEGEGYNLAQARNRGIIEATGDLLVFCDQSIVMDNGAVEAFVTNAKPRHWLYGSKGGVRKDMVENFSAIFRDDIVTMGSFFERCDRYGSMSQECRTRARAQGIQTEYIETAKAERSRKSRNRNIKRADIIKSKNMLYKLGLQ